jgi:hypothetical protein
MISSAHAPTWESDSIQRCFYDDNFVLVFRINSGKTINLREKAFCLMCWLVGVKVPAAIQSTSMSFEGIIERPKLTLRDAALAVEVVKALFNTTNARQQNNFQPIASIVRSCKSDFCILCVWCLGWPSPMAIYWVLAAITFAIAKRMDVFSPSSNGGSRSVKVRCKSFESRKYDIFCWCAINSDDNF